MSGLVPPPGDHGGDGPRVLASLGLDPAGLLDLSASLNPVAPDISPLVGRHLGALRRYPDVEPAAAALARQLDVDPARIVVTNGGAEAIALVAADLGGGWVEDPDFSLYARHLVRVEPGLGRWRSDPNNPTGVLAGPSESARVWDEAFYPLATGRWTSGRADDGAIVLGSLTKLFACPGLRIGYVLAPPSAEGLAMTARLRAAQPRWSVNGLAVSVLPELLAGADLPGWAAEIRRLRDALVKGLADRGFVAQESDANYVLVGGAGDLRARLAHHSVIVRDCTSFGLAGHVRIAVPGDADRVRLLSAIDARGGPE